MSREIAKAVRKRWKWLRRWWCYKFHGRIMFAGGRLYECRRCGQRFENPAVNPVSFEPNWSD
jgi:hypothetical protein